MIHNKKLQELLQSLDQFIAQCNMPENDRVGITLYYVTCYHNGTREDLVDISTAKTINFQYESDTLTLMLDKRELNLVEIDDYKLHYTDQKEIQEFVLYCYNGAISIHLTRHTFDE